MSEATFTSGVLTLAKALSRRARSLFKSSPVSAGDGAGSSSKPKYRVFALLQELRSFGVCRQASLSSTWFGHQVLIDKTSFGPITCRNGLQPQVSCLAALNTLEPRPFQRRVLSRGNHRTRTLAFTGESGFMPCTCATPGDKSRSAINSRVVYSLN